ncbi:hypothetical protein M422DRAFT_264812 [Sphaerobolus stellatus SS14]|uniref:Uncharacterized protein n=1 Tax=Sphaerobolus stellatus (strain SS14) TaxID=990650 RepID=A0A0C9TSK0_SPHS4|nr:hypothetical protein M422DRAFT_264812 [Sphaerobolus stellatus SS14]
MVTVDLLGDTRVANEHQAKYLCGIKTSQEGSWDLAIEDKEFADKEVEPAGPENMEEEVEEVCEEDKGGCKVQDDKTMKDPEVDEL